MDFSQVILTEAIFLDCSIRRNDNYGSNNNLVHGFSSQVSVHPTYDIEEKGIKVEVKVSCEAIDESHKSIGIEGSFSIGLTFYIKNIEDHIVCIPETKSTIPSPSLMVPLVGAAYSTARGMIIVKLLGTYLEGFTLPIMAAQDLLQPKKTSTPVQESKKVKRKTANK